MRTSKELFQSSPAFADFSQILTNRAFEPACSAALLGLIESLPAHSADPSKAWDAYLQIVGARRVLEILSELHVKDEPSKAVPFPTLNYAANTPKKP